MTYISDYRTAAELTGIARAAFEVAFQADPLAAYFPAVEANSRVFSLDQVAGIANATATRLVGYNTTAPRGVEGPAAQRITGRVVKTAESRHADEMSLVSTPSPSEIAAWQETQARALGASIANRLRIMVSELLTTGTLDISETGVEQVLNFNVPAANTVTLTGGQRWTQAGANPVENVRQWRDLTGGAGQMFVSSATLASLARNGAIIQAALRRGTDLPTSVSAADVLSVFAEDNVKVNVLDSRTNTVVDYSGVVRSLIPENTILILPDAAAMLGGPSSIGYTHLAPTLESENPKYGISAGERPGVFCAGAHHEDPEGYAVRAVGELIPLLKAPAALVTAKVA